MALAPRHEWRWERLLPLIPLLAALIAGAAVYAPALPSGFVADDYIYLDAVRSLSFPRYLHISLIPNVRDPALVLAESFWRPLFFLAFQPLERLFGANAMPYHLLNVIIHLAATVLVWLLARKLTGRWQAAGIATAVFAVHPAGVASIAWVSSLNSVALPLGLASWLLFSAAVERSPGGTVRWQRIAWSSVLMAVGLGVRETAAVCLIGLAVWYVLVPGRTQLVQLRTYLPLAPYAGLVLLYILLRTDFLTGSPGAGAPVRLGSQVPGHFWYYLKLALFPIHGNAEWESALRVAGAVAIVAVLAAAALLRRWLVVALILTFLVSIIPYAVLSEAVTDRYFYFPSALFALVCGAVAAELQRYSIPGLQPGLAKAACLSGVGAVLVLGGYVANGRVSTWVANNPGMSSRWVAQLRQQYPTLPEGGTLYVTNTPLLLAIFNGESLRPTVAFYYPQIGRVIDFNPYAGQQPVLGPDDRVFSFDSSK